MDSQRWQRLKLILAEALEQESPAARTALVGRSCGSDADLLREAKSLLAEAEPLLTETPDELEECANNFAAALPRKDASEIGKRIGAYVIIREIGQGGMGTVYLAARADGYFEKQVAIKLLKRGVANEEVLRRFRSEREVLARLDHPNIARLIDAGTTDDGLPYFVMEYVDGTPITRFVDENHETLADRLNLFLKISAAVEAAHRNSVIHRDLKSNNILVNCEGEPKLLDFGIAKFVGKNTNPLELTALGHERLTPASASPEQAKGEPVTISSDIYGLGVILYEMLTGVRPHRFLTSDPSREDLVEVVCKQLPTLASLVVKNRERQRQLRGDLDAILVRALQKEPALRYPSVAEFAEDIRRHLNGKPIRAREYEAAYRIKTRLLHNKNVQVLVGTAILALLFAAAFVFSSRVRSGLKQLGSQRSAASSGSIAILPFENLSEERANAYFAEGIQNEILTKLATVHDLKVISRTSMAKYQSKPDNLKAVAQELGVSNVLEGAVQKTGDKVRVNVRLIDARADTSLWAKSYDRDLKDVLGVESEVSQKIADALQAKLSASESHALSAVGTRDTEAYDLFLRGEYEFHQAESVLASAAYDRADAFYRQALARDPNFAQAGAELARSRLYRHWYISGLTATELEEVKSIIDRALTLAPNSPEAHLALGLFFYYGHHEYENALAEFNRTLELQPNNALVRQYCAWVYRRRGEWERSLADAQQAEGLDPHDAGMPANIGGTYVILRLWKDAQQAELRALALDPHNTIAAASLLTIGVNGTGDVASARRAFDGFLEDTQNRLFGQGASGYAAGGDVGTVLGVAVYLDVIERRFTDALQALEKRTSNNDRLQQLFPRVVLRLLAGQTEAAKSAGEEALPLLEARLTERPDDTLAMRELSWVYLALGRNADALRLSREAADLISIEKDAFSGPIFQNGLAQIEARAGAPEEAIKRLRHLLSIPAGAVASIARLRIDPVWDPIRNRPDFQQLLSGREQIGPGK